MPIRPATKDDLSDLYDMVLELSEFQQFRPGDITISREQYAQAFEDGCFKAFIAIDDETGKAAGMVICHNTFDCWKGKTMSMNQLIVRPQYRKKKYGKMLWAAVAQAAKDRGVTHLLWKVEPWNTAAIGFYDGVAGVSEVKDDKGLLQYAMSKEGIDQFVSSFSV